MCVFNKFQNVKVTHALNSLNDESRARAKSLFSGQPVPPVGNDGRPLKTSVCDEIQQSVDRAEKIEKHIANSKVLSTNTNLYSSLT